MIVTLGEPMMVFNGPPAGPITLGSSLRATFAGAESNVAIGLARLGHAVRYLTVLGDDSFGRIIARQLGDEGIDVSGVGFSPQHPTGIMFKNFDASGQVEVFYYRNTSAFAQVAAQTINPELWRDARLIYLTGITPALSPGCLALIHAVVNDARKKEIPVWLDPNYRPRLWDAQTFRQTLIPLLPSIDTILPGIAEGELLTGRRSAAEIARHLLDAGVKNVVLKADDAGAMAFDAAGVAMMPRFAVERAIDPVGAGDAFAAGFLSAYLENLPVRQRLERGHAMGAMICSSSGDWEALPNREQLGGFLSHAGQG